MESDSDECDNGDDKTVGEDDDCEEFGGDTPLLQEGQALLIVDYTRCLSAEMPHNPIRPNVYEEDDDHDEWTRSTYTTTASNLAVDTALSSKKQCSTQLYRRAQRKGQ
jgi:hypothetical protein